jgi:hypothetical protein
VAALLRWATKTTDVEGNKTKCRNAAEMQGRLRLQEVVAAAADEKGVAEAD